MRQADRVGAILERLSASGSVSVAELADGLAVSAATIRRDLELLDDQRLLTRTHGGAVAQGVLYELPLRYRTARHQGEKRRIASEAARGVADGEAIGLTGGTTTTEVARALVDRQRLTVVTNALNIASELAIRPNLKLVVTGGWARSESYELVGPLAELSLAGLNLDVVFLGVDGISHDAGLMTQRARRAVAVADSSKIGRTAFARICPIDRVDELITDSAADPRALDAIRDAGVVVSIV